MCVFDQLGWRVAQHLAVALLHFVIVEVLGPAASIPFVKAPVILFACILAK